MSTDRPIHREQQQDHHHDHGDTTDREQRYPGDVARLNEHELIVIDEWLPGREPTPYEIDLTNGYEYRIRYWRCRNCGQERNRREEFSNQCETPAPPTPLEAGGYSIDEPRTRRALTEAIDVQFVQPGPVYEVVSESESTYKVDVENETCTCPDFEQRQPDGGCKHLRRVALEIRTGLVPSPDGSFQRWDSQGFRRCNQPRLASAPECPDEIRQRTRTLAEQTEERGVTTGVHPAGFAAVSLYKAGQEHGKGGDAK